MAKLKVFVSRQGFFDTVVAAPSQKAALEAWGTHQNLFARGLARVAAEPDAVEAALARPGQVLRRAVGSSGKFALDGGGVTFPDPLKPKPAKGSRAASVEPAKPAPDRQALAAAEAELARAEAAHGREAAALHRVRDRLARELTVLDRRLREQQADAEPELRALRKATDLARESYRRAGGE